MAHEVGVAAPVSGTAGEGGQNGRRRDATAVGGPGVGAFLRTRGRVGTPGSRVLDVVVGSVTRVFFGRIRVHHRERIPRGALLVVANHPAAWADGFLLAMALRRRPHFLVHGPLFRPRIRGWLLHLYGALPLFPSRGDPTALATNAATMRACERHLERGEVVALFPEGVSRSDWRLQPLKLGAAWLALRHAARHGRAPSTPAFHLLPMGLFYRDRIAFRGDVEVVAGAPIDVTRHLDAFGRDPPEAARALTREIADSLRRATVDAPDMEVEALARVLSSMTAPAETRLERVREWVASLATMRRGSGDRFDTLWRRVKRYHRLRDALGLTDEAIRPSPGTGAVRAALRLALGLPLAPLALIGWGLHAIPAWGTRALTRRWADEPSRIAFARLAIGAGVFTAAYVAGGAMLHWGLGWPHGWTLLALAALAWIGAASRPYSRFMFETIAALRRAGLERVAPEAVARARRARRAVWSMVDPPPTSRHAP